MQADWASIGTGRERLSVFIATLGWSRMAYLVFCDNEKFETLRECREQAFEVFGGVPRELHGPARDHEGSMGWVSFKLPIRRNPGQIQGAFDRPTYALTLSGEVRGTKWRNAMQ